VALGPHEIQKKKQMLEKAETIMPARSPYNPPQALEDSYSGVEIKEKEGTMSNTNI